MQEKILIVDDEPEITDLIALYLENEDFAVFKCYNAFDALNCMKTERIDLAVLDVMLPDMDGFTLCKEIRENYQYPIIMLTAKGEEIDKIKGLALGADDYMTKPFLPLELVARIKAQLRRYKRYNGDVLQDQNLIVHGGLVLNIASHTCTLDEKVLPLTPTEFSILRILCQNKGMVVSAEELFYQIWGDAYFTKNNSTITVHIRHLREKMGDNFDNPKYIKTIWGCGYKIEE